MVGGPGGMIDENLRPYADERQWEIYTVYCETGSSIKTAKRLGINNASSVRKTVRRLKKRAAIAGYAPDADMTRPVPDPRYAKRVSTNYDQDGNVRQQWVISEINKDAQAEEVINRIAEVCDSIKPLKPVKAPKDTDDDLLTIYPLGDPHIGMYAWAAEAGEDFDCDIARQDLVNACAYLVSATPKSRECIILNVGDFFHADDPTNRTPQSGNQVDVDGRWPRVLEIGFFLLVDLVSLALKKHEVVRVRSTPGNHDPKSTIPLTLFLRAWFREDPRVIIEDSTPTYQYYSFGKCLFGFTHGHTIKKPTELGALMAVDCRELWSASEFRYWLHGHYHIKRLIEALGCLVEGFRNLPPNDAWHQSQGYRSGRDMCAITYHKEYGEVTRNTCDITRARA
jgi:transposase-like protein